VEDELTGVTAEPDSHLSAIDLYLRRRRFAKASPWLPQHSRVLDIGSSDLALFGYRPDLVGVGLDPDPQPSGARSGVELRRGTFPSGILAGETFDAIVMLAVAEHVQPAELRKWSAQLPAVLAAGGTLVITVPSPLVDYILHFLLKLKLVAGIAAHQHYGFRPAWVTALFSSPELELLIHKRFQLGLNNLFVFRRSSQAVDSGEQAREPM
jgi:hypothetical protein